MHLSTKNVTYLLAIFAIFLCIDLSFSNSGGFIFLLISAPLVYLAYTKKSKPYAIAAAIFLLLTIFSLWSVRLIPLLILLYFIYEIITNKDRFNYIIRPEPTTLFGEFETTTEFKWQDIQLQKVYGNITIDATETVLPVGKSIIHLQQGFGKASIYVPYEVNVELSIQTIYSGIQFMKEPKAQLLNSRLHLSDKVETDKRTLVIFITSAFTDVEVIRR